MQTIRVETTQNVYIHYPLASLGDRILAFIIDQLLLLVYIIAAVSVMVKLDVQSPWVVISCISIPYFFYAQTCEILMNGQTVGKMAMKVKVVRLDGTPPTFGDYVFRCLFQLVDFYILGGAVAMIAIGSSNKGQRLGDKVAGTSVVKLAREQEITSGEIFVMPDEEYMVSFPEVINLTSHDIELIQQALEVNRKHGNSKPVGLLSEKIKNVLRVDSDLPPVKFLYTVVKDFNHLTAQPA